MNEIEKYKALAQLSKALDKKNDTTNSLIFLGDKVGEKIPSISTGFPTLDFVVIGTGGIPKGRMIELYGPESSGKTSFALHVIAECQRNKGIAAFIDAEHALDPTWAALLGVNVDKLLVSQPDNGEQALDIVDQLVESQAVDLIVIDSVAALTPAAELAGEVGDAHVGLLPRLMSQALRILVGKCARNNVSIIWLNQIRDKIGTMWGSPEITPGGRALKFAASIRLDVRRKEELKSGSELLGHRIKITAKKNKCGVPFKETTVDLVYASGFDTVGDSIAYATSLGVFDMKGSWYHLGEERLANGLDNLKDTLKAQPKLLEKVNKLAQEKVNKLEV